MNPSPSQSGSILICSCQQARVFPADLPGNLEKLLRDAGFNVEIVGDVCDMAARKDPRLQQAASMRTPIVACHARAVKWLFTWAGAPLDNRAVVLNLREMAPEQVAAALGASLSGEHCHAPDTSVPVPTPTKPGEPNAWFPVIDFDRCVQCMQCLGFCLFGVYGVDSSKNVAVQNPDQCKPGCPACARVCPEMAIIFPKFKSGSISGAPVPTEIPQKIDISSLLGGDPHEVLRDRNARARARFSKDRSAEVALSERRKYLELNGLIADQIPPEVLSSLPSSEEIARKAEEAALRAREALEARKEL